MNETPLPLYVLDTHALYWYWVEPAKLGPAATSVFGSLERRESVGLVPLLVVAELHYLTSKRGVVLPVETIIRMIDQAPALRLEGLTRRHLVAFGQLSDIPEMHDRFIAAVGIVHRAPVLTRDPAIQVSARITTLW